MHAHTPSDLAPPRASFAAALGPLLVLALAMMLGFMMMQSFSTVQEGAKAELGLSDYALSLIQGVGAAVPLALFSIPIGLVVDRANRGRVLIGLAACWTAGTALTAIAPSGSVLFVARMLTGIGTTGALAAALSIGADLCVADQRGRAIWDRFYPAAPRPRPPFEASYSDRKLRSRASPRSTGSTRRPS